MTAQYTASRLSCRTAY